MNIDDIDEMQVNNIHLMNFHPYNYERALQTPRTQGLLSSTPALSITLTSKGIKQNIQMVGDYSSEFKEMTSAMNNILQIIMNINHQVWKSVEIIKYMIKLKIEGLYLFETVGRPIIILILLEYILDIRKSYTLNC